MRLKTLPALLFFASTLIVAAPTERWRIDSLSLVIDSERESALTLKAYNTQGLRGVDLTTKVRLTKIEESHLVGDRLAVLGQAGQAATVVIFDLSKGQELDWFYCILPPVLDSRIAYMEFYPPHISGVLREVVLVYELAKSPADNRLLSSRDRASPTPITGVPTEVGIPIYPQWNVQNSSYRYVAENPDEEEELFPIPTPFVSLGNNRLAWITHRGGML
jgi:hypothetical protein